MTLIAGIANLSSYLQRGSHVKQLSRGDDSKYSYCKGKRIFIGINLQGVLACMLIARWRTYVNKVVMNNVKHGCLLKEPMCIKGIKA